MIVVERQTMNQLASLVLLPAALPGWQVAALADDDEHSHCDFDPHQYESKQTHVEGDCKVERKSKKTAITRKSASAKARLTVPSKRRLCMCTQRFLTVAVPASRSTDQPRFFTLAGCFLRDPHFDCACAGVQQKPLQGINVYKRQTIMADGLPCFGAGPRFTFINTDFRRTRDGCNDALGF